MQRQKRLSFPSIVVYPTLYPLSATRCAVNRNQAKHSHSLTHSPFSSPPPPPPRHPSPFHNQIAWEHGRASPTLSRTPSRSPWTPDTATLMPHGSTAMRRRSARPSVNPTSPVSNCLLRPSFGTTRIVLRMFCLPWRLR